MRYLILLAALTATQTAVAADSSPLEHGRFALGGYGDVGYTDSDFSNNQFSGKFVPIFLFQLNDRIHVEAELEFGVGDNGETETELEYADLHYFLGDRTVLTAGKFLLPFGQFGPNLHPSWINRLPTAPGIYGGHGGNGLMTGVVPVLSDQGAALQHTFDLGGSRRLFIDVYAVNGVGTEAHADEPADATAEDDHAAFPEIEFESSSSDINNNKALGGRIALAALPGLEIGYSAYRSKYDELEQLDFNASALDLYWAGQFWSVRGEYIQTEADGFLTGDDHDEEPADDHDDADAGDDHDEEAPAVPRGFDRDGWYLQFAWQLRQFQVDALNPVELVLRHSRMSRTGAGERWTVGLNYWLTPSAALKLAYEDTRLDDGRDDNRVFLQLSYGF